MTDEETLAAPCDVFMQPGFKTGKDEKPIIYWLKMQAFIRLRDAGKLDNFKIVDAEIPTEAWPKKTLP